MTTSTRRFRSPAGLPAISLPVARPPLRWLGLALAALAALALAYTIRLGPARRLVATPPLPGALVEREAAPGRVANGGAAADQAAAGLASSAPTTSGAAGAPAEAAKQAAAGSTWALPPLPSADRMIVKTGTLTVRVADLTAAMQRVEAVVAAIPGAYVATSSTSYLAGAGAPAGREGIVPAPPAPPLPARPATSASLTLKVPADSFSDAVQRLRALGTPLVENVSTQEVTEEFVDLQAQARNLEATEQQYLRLLERAQRIEDILPIQQRLTDVRGQIERLRGRMNLLQRRADVSTISLTLVLPPGQADPAGSADEPRAVRTLRVAFGQLSAMLQGTLDLAIYLGVFTLPLAPFVLFYLWWRSRQRRTASAAAPAPGAI
jgi:hypothetical protein